MLPLCRYASTEVARQRYWLGAPRPVLARTQTALRAGKPNREAAVPQSTRTAQLQLKMRNFKQASANSTIRAPTEGIIRALGLRIVVVSD